MARSEADIVKDLGNSILSTDKTLDIEQGPLPDVFIRPQAGELAIASEEAESLRVLFTLQFSASATDDEVKNALANYGSTPGAGRKARHLQHFMRFTRPNKDIVIPAGALVSNINGNLIYRVVSGGTILAISAPSFYNAQRKSYEIGLLVEAVGIGAKYNLPINRVIKVLTSVDGIDSTENRNRSTGGFDKETKDQQSTRLKNALLGINLGSPGGITNSIKDGLPEVITDVAVIQPFEKEFTRNITSPALDIYNIGLSSAIYTQSYSALGGENQIVLTKVPVLSISTVTINEVAISDYTLVNDSTVESGNSLAAVDLVVLGIPLIFGDIVIIEYNYNQALYDVYELIYNSGTEYLFNTDMLIRSPFEVAPVLDGKVQALASYSVTEVENNVQSFFATEFTFQTFTEIVYPEVIRQRVITEVSGVQNFTLTEFRRSKGSNSTIEPLVYARNEISIFDVDYYNISVVS